MVSISAVVTTYNRRYEVVRAIKSIYAQTILPDEIIVIDNGSDDGTLDYISQYDFSGIVLINSKDYVEGNGVGIARNLGTRLASCDYIAFLDSDNEWYPNKIEIFKNNIEEAIANGDKPDIVFSHYYYHEKSYKLERPTASQGRTETILNMAERSLLQRYADGSASIYNKAFLNDIGGFDERLRTNVDWELLLRTNYGDGNQEDRLILEIGTILSENHTMFDSLEEDGKWELRDRLSLLKQYKKHIDELRLCHLSAIVELYEIYMKEVNIRMDKVIALDELIDNLDSVQDSKDIINKILEDNGMVEEKLERQSCLRSFENKWLNDKLNGINVEDNLEAMGIRRIAIYGAGNYGKMLYKELKDSHKVEIAYYIDRNRHAMEDVDKDVMVYTLDDDIPEVDKIIVTPFMEWNSIRRALEIKGTDNIIPVYEVV